MNSAKVWCSVFLVLGLNSAEAVTSTPIVKICQEKEGCKRVMPNASFSSSVYQEYKNCLSIGRAARFCAFAWGDSLGFWVCVIDSCPGYEGLAKKLPAKPGVLKMKEVRARGRSIGYERRREKLSLLK